MRSSQCRARPAALLGSLSSAAAHAADAPLSYLQTHGPAADPVTRLGWGLGGLSIGVMAIVAVLLLYAIFRPLWLCQ